VGCGVWGVGCGVWGVGCGVWGVGCGVWGTKEPRLRIRGMNRDEQVGGMRSLILLPLLPTPHTPHPTPY